MKRKPLYALAGLPGAGKDLLARFIFKTLETKSPCVVRFGDIIRDSLVQTNDEVEALLRTHTWDSLKRDPDLAKHNVRGLLQEHGDFLRLCGYTTTYMRRLIEHVLAPIHGVVVVGDVRGSLDLESLFGIAGTDLRVLWVQSPDTDDRWETRKLQEVISKSVSLRIPLMKVYEAKTSKPRLDKRPLVEYLKENL